jgi:hypothetical protein
MKNLLLILLLSLSVLSCNLLTRRDSPSTVQPTPSPSPVAPKKIVDVPSLIGKTPDEVKSIIGLTPKIGTDFTSKGVRHRDYKYEFRDIGTASIKFKNEKFDGFFIILDKFIFDTPEQLGDFFGVDVRGKTPPTTVDDTVFYEDLKFNGVNVKSLSLGKYAATGFNQLIMNMN